MVTYIILKYFNLSYIDTYIAHWLSSFFLGSHVYVHSTYWHEKVATSSFLQIMSRLHYHTKIFVKLHLNFTNVTWDISKNLELSIPNGCLDAYEIKVNIDIFKYQEKVKLISQFQRFFTFSYESLLHSHKIIIKKIWSVCIH